MACTAPLIRLTLFPKLHVENDGGHAFYLGVELARAEIAWQLGKRYTQDQALKWGCATDQAEPTVDLHTFKPAGTTFAKPVPTGLGIHTSLATKKH